VNANAIGFKKTLGICGIIGAWSAAGAFYGCSSSSNNAGTPGEDAGTPETSAPAPVNDSSTVVPEASTTADAGASQVSQKVVETKLFADNAEGGAAAVDPQLVNPWGLAFNPSGPAWVADNGTGLATVYKTGVTTPVLTVRVPGPGDGGGISAPSGQIFNSTTDFENDKFIFCTEDGTVSGWGTGADGGLPAAATLRADNSGEGAVFKGLAIVPSTPQILLVADFHNNKIDAFSASYAPITADAGTKWTDPSIPAGYAPFNIVTVGTSVYVVYAQQDSMAHDEKDGAGLGAVSEYDFTGTLVKSLIAVGGALNGPWGLVPVPTGGWGAFPAGTLLVGNFGDGAIHAYDPTSGALLGSLFNGLTPLLIDGLWAIEFGPEPADAGGTPSQLYFTSGPNGENDGLFGYLTIAP
jgi:uncharacterized protein (TIGR03118 family)